MTEPLSLGRAVKSASNRIQLKHWLGAIISARYPFRSVSILLGLESYIFLIITVAGIDIEW